MPRPNKLYFSMLLHKEFEETLTEKVSFSNEAGYFPDYVQEQFELFLLKHGYKLVRNKKRAQKLIKRGESMRWSWNLSGWFWVGCAT